MIWQQRDHYRSQRVVREDGIWFDGIYSLPGFGAQLESHSLMVALQKASTPA